MVFTSFAVFQFSIVYAKNRIAFSEYKNNKPRTAQVGAISKALQNVKFLGKIDNVIREMKTLVSTFENVASEL